MLSIVCTAIHFDMLDDHHNDYMGRHFPCTFIYLAYYGWTLILRMVHKKKGKIGHSKYWVYTKNTKNFRIVLENSEKTRKTN